METEQQYNIRVRQPIDTIVIHHSDTPRDADWKATLKSVDASHKGRLHGQRNGLGYYIAYHYIVFGGGKVVQTRPENEVGYHAGHWATNRRSIGICFVGRFQKETVNKQQITAAMQLIKTIKSKYKIIKIGGHRNFKNTQCPGKNMTDGIIKQIYG